MYMNTILELSIRLAIVWEIIMIRAILDKVIPSTQKKLPILLMRVVPVYLGKWGLLWCINLMVFSITGCKFDIIRLIFNDYSECYIEVLDDTMFDMYIVLFTVIGICIILQLLAGHRYIKNSGKLKERDVRQQLESTTQKIAFIVTKLIPFTISLAIVHSMIMLDVLLIAPNIQR